jgi:N-acyl amino acid synthase of PEP-CTERM/exosortase system
MRLIFPGERPLPIESICAINSGTLSEQARGHLAEVSRMCMVARYRRRAREPDSPCEIPMQSHSIGSRLVGVEERRQEPEILLGLLCAAVQYSREHDIHYWYYLGSPALSRMMRRYNIDTQQAGPECVHRGTRFPYLADLDLETQRASQGSSAIARMLQGRVAYRRYTQLFSNHKKRGLALETLS